MVARDVPATDALGSVEYSPDELDCLFLKRERSAFRRKFRLEGRELGHLHRWGLDHVLRQADQIVRERLAPAQPRKDGRQTPWRNHPVFVAQHATATCCRGCLEKNHGIPRGLALTGEHRDYVLAVLRRWLGQYARPDRPQQELF